MHGFTTSRDMFIQENLNTICNSNKLRNPAAQSSRNKNSPELCVAGFFNLFELRMVLLSFSHEFAKQENTTLFDAGGKTAITQSILHGFA